jgi:ubiquinone/menaquinone biosynthesis C-methylase UbiE
MSRLAERLNDRFFPGDHPYRTYEREVERQLRPHHTLLDAGCGRTAPILSRFRGKAARLIGVDLVDFTTVPDGMELHTCDLGALPLADDSVDVIMARSVMEHVTDPA